MASWYKLEKSFPGVHMAAPSQVPSKTRHGTRALLATCHSQLFISNVPAFSKLLSQLSLSSHHEYPWSLQQGSELNIGLSFQNHGED